MATVTVKSVDGLAHEVTAGDYRILVDEHAPTGEGRGFDPYELLLASLGS